ncbi:MAG: HlyC/CorC family transporter [Firmicutes bacterium]|nr:HlyC/CorC family transporter [Bacillota bacterium]
MDGHSIMPSVALIIGLLLLSAYFSATETAFTSLNRIRIKNKADAGDEQAKRVLHLEQNYDNLLSTILIGNNLVNIATTAVATVLFVKLYGPYGATIATIVTTVVVLIFGEITPKSLAKEYPEKFAMFSAPLINALRIILMPINWIFGQWKKLLNIVFKTGGNQKITEDELVTIVDEAFVTGGIGERENELIQNAIGFSELQAQDILTPRVEIEAVEIDTDIKEIDALFRDTGYSRLPVYEDDLDTIIGVLAQKDFYNYIYRGEKTVADMVKPVIYVAESMRAAELLRKLQESKSRMAVVVDEYGGTSGLVTAEDIIEELVGEIYDESDTVAERDITLMQNGTYRVLGSANVENLFEFFGEEIGDIDATTVNGWAAIILDHLPKRGDRFEYKIGDKLFRVLVTKADDRKALELNLRVEGQADNK